MAQVTVSKKNPCLAIVLALQYAKNKCADISLQWGDTTVLSLSSGGKVSEESTILRYIARSCPECGLYGGSFLDSAQVDQWVDFSQRKFHPGLLKELDTALVGRTFLVGHGITLADLAIFGFLHGNRAQVIKFTDVQRWFASLSAQALLKAALSSVSQQATAAATAAASGKKKEPKKDEGGKFIELPGAKMGEVVVRFPPEASGYLHIGHAKAALLNQYYQLNYKGKLVMRFDDTNPAKEDEHFEQVILDDVKLLNIKPDIFTCTSDHFDVILDYARKLIKDGLAFCDDTEAEEMKKVRERKEASKYRETGVEENLKRFAEMETGSTEGQRWCLRAKMDYKSDNGCLRDPTIYRCRSEPHVKTGTKYKVYPTYDFACPIVDSREGVTHALRTTEYHDRDDQYEWFLQKLELRHVNVWEYSRLTMVSTVMSKRKLKWFVEDGRVDGWDDPRFPTVRGILRRGLTVDGLKQFIISQGSSRANVHMEWDKIWAVNRRVIDPVAPRYTALLQKDAVSLVLEGDVETHSKSMPRHPKNADVGEKTVWFSKRLFLEGADAAALKEGDRITLINWCNAQITGITKNGATVTELSAKLLPDDKNFKDTVKVTWLADVAGQTPPMTVCTYFDNLITKEVLTKDDNFKDYINDKTKWEENMIGDPCLVDVKRTEIIQLQRRGYFICDQPFVPASGDKPATPCVLFAIPDGHSKTKATGPKTDGAAESKSGSARKKEAGTADAPKKKEDKAAKKAKAAKAPADAAAPVAAAVAAPAAAAPAAAAPAAAAPAAAAPAAAAAAPAATAAAAAPAAATADATSDAAAAGPSKKDLKRAKKAAEKAEKKAEKKTDKKTEKKATQRKISAAGGADAKKTRLGLEVKKEEDFAEWYTQVITKAKMIEYYDVSGCYVIRPWAYSIWESIHDFFDSEIKKLGVRNASFPMFVSQAALEREKDHIADFAPEVAWVTKAGQSDLAEPIAIRPTSETSMYPCYAKWIQSHRDLPLKINQWNNVVRWEFKHPQPFLRTREFLWQEGHTAFADKSEAVEEVFVILDLYARIYEELMAIPVVKGRKTEKEKFAGGDFTTTVEGFIPTSGRGIQGATSHHLGQNFSKMFDIVIEDPKKAGEKLHVFQNSWGITTRTIGVMCMVHGDNRGLVLPPRLAELQVVIVPCGITGKTSPEDQKVLIEACRDTGHALSAGGIRCHVDDRDNVSPGWKFNHWEMKGVPVRMEIGPKDLAQKQVTAVLRYNSEKLTVASDDNLADKISDLLYTIQKDMFAKALAERDAHIKQVTKWADFCSQLEQKNLLLAPYCGVEKCEDSIKKESARTDEAVAIDPNAPAMGAKSLCIPLEQPEMPANSQCIHPKCTNSSSKLQWTLFGRSY